MVLTQHVPPLLWELYPDAREIVLVRDFRDMVSSMFAFDAERGFDGFGGRTGSDKDRITEAGKEVARLLDSWRERSDRAHLVRYEDLITRPHETARSLLAYLDLKPDERAVEKMLRALDERTDQTEWHRTTDDPKSSIGRWREDLDDDLRRACDEALGPELEAFGYSRETCVSA